MSSDSCSGILHDGTASCWPAVLLPAEAQDFKKKFEEAQEINAKIIGIPVTAEPDEEAEAADELADQVAKAAV